MPLDPSWWVGTRRIRAAIRRKRYVVTLHALEEMDEDDVSEIELRDALLNGRLVARLRGDPRGIRLVVRGAPRRSRRTVEVVCRFLPSGLLRIIAAYCVEE